MLFHSYIVLCFDGTPMFWKKRKVDFVNIFVKGTPGFVGKTFTSVVQSKAMIICFTLCRCISVVIPHLGRLIEVELIKNNLQLFGSFIC